MDADALLSVVVALVCVAGVGMTAATMESAVETTPDDVIDIEASSVPLGPGQLQEYKERLQGGPREGETDGGSAPSEETTSAPAEGGAGESAPAPGGGSSPDRNAGDDGRQRQVTTQSQGAGPEEGTGPADPSLLDRLLSFLRWLLGTLLAALPLLLGLALVALLAANRRRLAALVAEETVDDGPPPVDAGDPAPRNDVAAAWHEMVARAGVERPETKTPRQCARAAVAAGADRDAVESLTRAFEEVRYGGAPITDERRRRAREALDRVAATGGER